MYCFAVPGTIGSACLLFFFAKDLPFAQVVGISISIACGETVADASEVLVPDVSVDVLAVAVSSACSTQSGS